MRYFVITPDGHRYGPADPVLLNQWIQEGRLLPGHELEVEGTGQRVAAHAVPGLQFGPPTTFAAPASPPSPASTAFSIQPLQTSADPEHMVKQAWNMGIAGVASVVLLGFCCQPFAIAGGIFGAVGLNHALNAKRLGSLQVQGPLVLNAIAIALAILSVFGGLSSLLTPWRW